MPMSVVYATVNGRMVQENRGGTITRYVADTLGSVIQTRNASGVQSSSTTYWPYGEARTSSGTNPSPWGFVGTLGYFRDALSRLYIRARYYIASIGRLNTVDPLWPDEAPYGYVDGIVTLGVDVSGTFGSNEKQSGNGFGKYILPYPLYEGNQLPDVWGYGNWCGKNRPGNGFSKAKPVDCLDACCRVHDVDLGNCDFYGQTGRAHCNLAVCAIGVDCKKSPFPTQCLKAKADLIKAMIFLCGIEGSRNSSCVCPPLPVVFPAMPPSCVKK